jgi:hypothetical protein
MDTKVRPEFDCLDPIVPCLLFPSLKVADGRPLLIQLPVVRPGGDEAVKIPVGYQASKDSPADDVMCL